MLCSGWPSLSLCCTCTCSTVLMFFPIQIRSQTHSSLEMPTSPVENCLPLDMAVFLRGPFSTIFDERTDRDPAWWKTNRRRGTHIIYVRILGQTENEQAFAPFFGRRTFFTFHDSPPAEDVVVTDALGGTENAGNFPCFCIFSIFFLSINPFQCLSGQGARPTGLQ